MYTALVCARHVRSGAFRTVGPSAAVAGLGLGFYAPALDTAVLFSSGTVELIPDTDTFFAAVEEQG